MKIQYHQDDTTSPTDWADTNLFLVAGHREFYVPAPNSKRVTGSEVDIYSDTHWVFLIEAYIHGGVTLAFTKEGNFPDRQWDVSNVGAIFVEKAEWSDKGAAKAAAESLMETWNLYLSGDVWGYTIKDDEGNEVDSCWGYYGRNAVEEAANDSLKHFSLLPA